MLGKQSPTLQGLVVVDWMVPMMFTVFTLFTVYLVDYLVKYNFSAILLLPDCAQNISNIVQ